MKFTTTFVAAIFAAAASAYTPPDNSKPPEGNPIGAPGLNEQVPVGAPFHITWKPTTFGSVSILLLRGPSTHVVPISTIADTVPNTGVYTWIPSTDLENDYSHYGIQIIVEETGQYQYSPQFGIKNDKSSAAQVHEEQPVSSSTAPSAVPEASDAAAQATEEAVESAPIPAPTLSAGNPSVAVAAASTDGPNVEAVASAAAANPAEQSGNSAIPIDQTVSSAPVIHAVPAPTVQPIETLTPAATITPTSLPAPSASNFPAKPSAPLPFNVSSGAVHHSVALGSLVMTVLAAMIL